MPTSRPLLPLAVALIVVLPGCGTREENDVVARAPDAATEVTGAGAFEVSTFAVPDVVADRPLIVDPDVPVDSEATALGVLNAINEHEIATAKQALEKGVGGEVKEYARQMVDAYTTSRAQTAALDPDEASPAVQAQAAKAQAVRDRLGGRSGDDYERAFIAAMIDDHAEALALLDTQLIPAATSPAVRAHLAATRGHVAHRLEQARRLDTE